MKATEFGEKLCSISVLCLYPNQKKTILQTEDLTKCRLWSIGISPLFI